VVAQSFHRSSTTPNLCLRQTNPHTRSSCSLKPRRQQISIRSTSTYLRQKVRWGRMLLVLSILEQLTNQCGRRRERKADGSHTKRRHSQRRVCKDKRRYFYLRKGRVWTPTIISSQQRLLSSICNPRRSTRSSHVLSTLARYDLALTRSLQTTHICNQECAFELTVFSDKDIKLHELKG